MVSDTMSQPDARTFTPEDIVAEVLAGRVRVPSFQRRFRWQWEDVRRLFDSIARGYPIGNLLLWERDAEQQHIRIGALDIDAPAGKALFAVDGQQRVTSLANALTEQGARDPRFCLAFDIKSGNFEKYEPDGPAHLVPLHVIFDLQKLLTWFADHPDVNQKPWFEQATRLAKAIRQYAIPAYVVKQQDEKVLRDIFDRMNNHGRRLGRAEVFSALHGGATQDGPDLHFSAIADAIDAATGFGRIDDDTVLLTFLARRGGDVARDIRKELEHGNKLDFAGESPEVAYRSAQDALERAVRFLQVSAGVPHFGFLPYRYLIVVLTRFFALHPDPSPRNRTLLRRFFWRAALAGPSVFRGWTNAMRTLVPRIKGDDGESESVQRLLGEIKEHEWVLPRLTHFRTGAAETRVILCALWSLNPMSPVDGSTYDLDAIASALRDESRPTSALGTFFPQAPESLRGWAANRAIVLDEVENDARITFVEGLRHLDAPTRKRILKSHALDERMLEFLEEDRAEDFLRARKEQLASVLRGFVEKMFETRFEDTPPLDDFVFDEEDERRDDEIRE